VHEPVAAHTAWLIGHYFSFASVMLTGFVIGSFVIS
jgi:hypothetical protein